MIRGRDVVGFPSGPGRGFWEDIPIELELTLLVLEPVELLTLRRRQHFAAPTIVAIGRRNPVSDCPCLQSILPATS